MIVAVDSGARGERAVSMATSMPSPDGRAEAPGRLIVTIDGPAGTGKSTVARALARRLGLEFLDTGAMYRAAAVIALDGGIAPVDEDALCAAVERADLRFRWDRDPPELLAFGRCVMHRLREPEVTAIVSRIAALPRLRRGLVARQQAIAREHPRLLSEGRDQGSVVFPDADVKFYLDAAPGVRAARRADQLRAGGFDVSEAELLREIVARDESDSTRAEGPLVRPRDAVLVDTSALGFDEVVDRLEMLVRGALRARAGGPDGGRAGG